jgi:phosphomannomutase
MSFILDEQTVIAADLDGTLTLSKMPMESVMADIVSEWLYDRRFAILSGATFERLAAQIISRLPPTSNLENLFLFPTNGAACYIHKNRTWIKAYEESLSAEERIAIKNALQRAVATSGITVDQTYGEQIEFRGGQVTFSALGQMAPLDKKIIWDPIQEKRKEIVKHLKPFLTDFSISIGGATSIDITRKGVDKAYAIERMMDILNVDKEHILFFGDAIFDGGNDYAAIRTGVTTIQVANPEETAFEIRKIIALKDKKG